MEYESQRLLVLTNDLSLSLHNQILVYSFLGLYGLLMLMVIAYEHARFRTAAKTLKLLETEWQSAESRHANFVGAAHAQLSKLSAPAVPLSRSNGIGSEVRNQIVAMAKRGTSANDIARTCGLQEGEVDVILGMARLQR
jgi:hypothetical protein